MRKIDFLPPLVLWSVLVLVGTLLLRAYLPPGVNILLVDVFIATNLATFCLYGYDKLCAAMQQWRVPELVLYATTLLGGPFGALLGMNVFHHKTRKTSFQFSVAMVILVQIVVVFLYLKY